MVNLRTLNIYLASNSPRRKAVFDFMDLKYSVLPLSIEEKSNEIEPLSYCLDIVGSKLQGAKAELEHLDNSLIVVADTVVCLGREKLGKPKDRKNAYEMLEKLSGRVHKVITGVGYHVDGTDYLFHDETEVEFMNLNSQMINYYLDKNTFFDKAGSYAIQSEDCFFVSKINGSFSNIVGFPLEKFREEFDI